MAQSFVLHPHQNADISFSFSAVWHNRIMINDPINGTITRGNRVEDSDSMHTIRNETNSPITVSVSHHYKVADTGGHPFISTIGRKTVYPVVKGSGIEEIEIGFEDQNHGTFKNAVANIKIK